MYVLCASCAKLIKLAKRLVYCVFRRNFCRNGWYNYILLDPEMDSLLYNYGGFFLWSNEMGK